MRNNEPIGWPVTAPMLSGTIHAEHLEAVDWPVLASPKIDGIRCIIHPELGPVTRTFKPLANEYVRQKLGWEYMKGLDGELVAMADDEVTVLPFNATQSALMSRAGEPKFRYYVFDRVFNDAEVPYNLRYEQMRYHLSVNQSWCHGVVALDHNFMFSPDDFLEFFQKCLAEGYEGAMIRAMDGPYKSGRSTRKQGWLLKYKDWQDAEGTIIGFEELLHNDNPQERDAFDHAKRSSHKDNLRAAGTLGALILSTEWGELRVGTGFDAALRDTIWSRNQDYLGTRVTFKYQSHGMQDKPRFPVFKGFRHD